MKEKSVYDRKYLLLLLCYLMGSSTLSIIAPILPYQMKEKNIDESYVGIIFCIFSVAGFIISQIWGRYMPIFGAKLFIYGGLVLFCLSHYQFALLDFVYNPILFVFLAVVARIWEGVSYGVIGSTTYGVSSQELSPKEFDKYARLNSTVAGLGQGFSLIMGSFFFSFGGYMLPYFILGSVFITLAIIIYVTSAFVEKQDPWDEKQDQAISLTDSRFERVHDSKSEEIQEHINHKFAFSIPTVKYGCVSIIISNIWQTFLDPIMAMKLYKYGIMADKSGYVFIFYVMSYSFFGFLGGHITQYATKRTLILSGYLIGCVTFCLVGHEFFVGDNFLLLIVIGLFLNGLSWVWHNMFATMFVKAELMEAAERHGLDKGSVGGYFGGLKSSCNLIGGFLGPLISSYLYLQLGFELTCISLAAFELVYFWVFYFRAVPTPQPQEEAEMYRFEKVSV